MITTTTEPIVMEINKNTRCPICQTEFLQVQESEQHEKFMICPVCGVTFKSAPSSDHLMFVETPINFPNNLVGLWLSRAQIGKALHDFRMTNDRNGVDYQGPRKAVEIPKANPLRAQAVREARTIINAGKSPEFVRNYLTRELQLSKYAIDEIILDAVAVKKAQRKQNMQKWAYSLFAFFLLLVLIYIALMVMYG